MRGRKLSAEQNQRKAILIKSGVLKARGRLVPLWRSHDVKLYSDRIEYTVNKGYHDMRISTVKKIQGEGNIICLESCDSKLLNWRLMAKDEQDQQVWVKAIFDAKLASDSAFELDRQALCATRKNPVLKLAAELISARIETETGNFKSWTYAAFKEDLKSQCAHSAIQSVKWQSLFLFATQQSDVDALENPVVKSLINFVKQEIGVDGVSKIGWYRCKLALRKQYTDEKIAEYKVQIQVFLRAVIENTTLVESEKQALGRADAVGIKKDTHCPLSAFPNTTSSINSHTGQELKSHMAGIAKRNRIGALPVKNIAMGALIGAVSVLLPLLYTIGMTYFLIFVAVLVLTVSAVLLLPALLAFILEAMLAELAGSERAVSSVGIILSNIPLETAVTNLLNHGRVALEDERLVKSWGRAIFRMILIGINNAVKEDREMVKTAVACTRLISGAACSDAEIQEAVRTLLISVVEDQRMCAAIAGLGFRAMGNNLPFLKHS